MEAVSNQDSERAVALTEIDSAKAEADSAPRKMWKAERVAQPNGVYRAAADKRGIIQPEFQQSMDWELSALLGRADASLCRVRGPFECPREFG